jgi:hypothetical protein
MVSTVRVWYGAILIWSRDDLDYTAAMRADQLLLASGCTSALQFVVFSCVLCSLPVNLYHSVICACLGYGTRNSFMYDAVAVGIYVL